MTQLLALDWGTSSLRGVVIDSAGRVGEERAFARGILTVPPGGFTEVFAECFGDWIQPDTVCLISGMAGSQQGWLEAPYCPCPAGFGDIASHLAWVDFGEQPAPCPVAIVPGLSIESSVESGSLPDVMRGEETQVFGALRILGLANATLVHPGTHSKWVTVTDGRIVNFSTWMTGELYALLRRRSILARTMPPEEPEFDAAAFEQGATHSLAGNPLLQSAFTTRTLALFKRMAGSALPSYLSGLVIGEELRCQNLQRGSRVILMGAPALMLRYDHALDLIGVQTQKIGSDATWQGLLAIFNTLSPDRFAGRP